MHQFVDAGIALYNPDKPDRPVNSPRPFIRLKLILKLLQSFGTSAWRNNLTSYLAGRETVALPMEREQNRVPVKMQDRNHPRLGTPEIDEHH